MDKLNLYFESNRKLWNERTPLHQKSEFYDVEAFIKGKNTLNQIELSEVGNVDGKKLLHLQCHFGQDTLSWARLGAKATGIDISDASIAEAKRLTKQLGLDASFVQSNIYDLKENLQDKYDIIFTSYGTIGWLPDLDKWANIISYFLKPGGFFYMVEFHPVVWMFDDDIKEIVYPYQSTQEPIVISSESSYTDGSTHNPLEEYSWNHSLAEVINALIKHGMKLEHLNEFSYSPYNCFRGMVKGEDGFWQFEHLKDKLPLVYSVKATKV